MTPEEQSTFKDFEENLDASIDVDTQPVSEVISEAVASSEPEDVVSTEDDLGSSVSDEEQTSLGQELESLRVQLEERNSQYMRLAADFDNFRRRTQTEKEELEHQVKRKTLSELLQVIDNFDRARSQIKPSSEEAENVHKSYQGIYKQLVESLKRIGVAPMRAEGKPFDPNLHEAIMREPTVDYEEGVVIEELVRGYLLGEKVLRHAMVKVATLPESEGDA
jgi:molecular chaperone GrpE